MKIRDGSPMPVMQRHVLYDGGAMGMVAMARLSSELAQLHESSMMRRRHACASARSGRADRWTAMQF
jgi:hypothetical protein